MKKYISVLLLASMLGLVACSEPSNNHNPDPVDTKELERLSKELTQLESEKKKVETERTRLQSRLDEETRGRARVQGELNDETRNRNEIQGRLNTEIQSRNRIQGQLNDAVRDRNVVQNQLNNETQNRNRIQDQLNNGFRIRAEIQNRLNFEIQDRNRIQGQLDNAVRDRNVIQNQLNNETQNRNRIQGQLDNEVRNRGEMQARLNIRIAQLGQEADALNRRIRVLNERLEEGLTSIVRHRIQENHGPAEELSAALHSEIDRVFSAISNRAREMAVITQTHDQVNELSTQALIALTQKLYDLANQDLVAPYTLATRRLIHLEDTQQPQRYPHDPIPYRVNYTRISADPYLPLYNFNIDSYCTDEDVNDANTETLAQQIRGLIQSFEHDPDALAAIGIGAVNPDLLRLVSYNLNVFGIGAAGMYNNPVGVNKLRKRVKRIFDEVDRRDRTLEENKNHALNFLGQLINNAQQYRCIDGINDSMAGVEQGIFGVGVQAPQHIGELMSRAFTAARTEYVESYQQVLLNRATADHPELRNSTMNYLRRNLTYPFGLIGDPVASRFNLRIVDQLQDMPALMDRFVSGGELLPFVETGDFLLPPYVVGDGHAAVRFEPFDLSRMVELLKQTRHRGFAAAERQAHPYFYHGENGEKLSNALLTSEIENDPNLDLAKRNLGTGDEPSEVDREIAARTLELGAFDRADEIDQAFTAARAEKTAWDSLIQAASDAKTAVEGFRTRLEVAIVNNAVEDVKKGIKASSAQILNNLRLRLWGREYHSIPRPERERWMTQLNPVNRSGPGIHWTKLNNLITSIRNHNRYRELNTLTEQHDLIHRDGARQEIEALLQTLLQEKAFGNPYFVAAESEEVRNANIGNWDVTPRFWLYMMEKYGYISGPQPTH